MTTPGTDHRQEWQPPPRPEWVQRINEEGYCMNISGVVPLDEKSLLDAAMRSTGLSDFGAEDWREPFRVLIKSLEEEAELNLMGRLMTRSDILMHLEARLRIEDTYKRHPEINDEKIVQPIIIIGQGRSGTSFMQNVLAHNPDAGALMHWKVMFPCPPPEKATYKTDPRIEKADKLVKQWVRVTPSFVSMHEMAGDLPFEDTMLTAVNFMSPSLFGCYGQIPSYDAYIFGNPNWDWEPAFRYHQRVLKLLQWKNPCQNWVLKDPMHLDRFAAILKVYPDACFVWPHRDPVRSLASLVSIIGTVHWGRSDHPFKGGLDYMTDPFLSAGRFNAAIDQIESGVVPAKQIHSLFYQDLVADTIGSLERMYRHFGIPLSTQGRAGMVKYLAEHPRDSRPPHKVNAGSDATIARARQAFKRYQDYFKVPSE